VFITDAQNGYLARLRPLESIGWLILLVIERRNNGRRCRYFENRLSLRRFVYMTLCRHDWRRRRMS